MAANFDLGFFDENSSSNDSTSRFDSKNKKEQDDLMENRHRENTKKATRSAINILHDYLKEKNLKNLTDLEDDELPEIFLDFYSNLKKAKGGDYKLQTLKCIRAGINRYTKEARNLDIISDLRFSRTNEMFKAVTTKARKDGLGFTKTTPPIEEEDLPKITAYLEHDMMNNPDPKKLQKYVLFNLIYYFCRRGRQNIHAFTLDTFKIGSDPDGTRFVYQNIDEMDKNHSVDNTLPANDGRMYESPGNPLCPVQWFVTYTSKLHSDYNFLWQRPKRGKLHFTDKIWFDRIRVGHGPIENFMAILSQEAALSKRYTNHSIRSTVMGLLGQKYEGRIVIGLSGHKNEATVKQYIQHLPTKTKREMSEYLNENIQPKKSKNSQENYQFKSKPAENNSKPPQQETKSLLPQENQPPIDPIQQFHLENVDDNPEDDMLVNFLAQFDPVPQQPAVPEPAQNDPEQIQQQALMPNNTMNISNVSNVQNVNANKQQVPTMFFGGHATVTINYNFAPKQ